MTHAIAKVAKQTFLKTTIECESFVRMEEERIKLLINMGIVDMYFCNEEKTLILEIIKNSSIPDSKKDVFCRDIENSPSKLYSIDYTLFRKEKFYGVNLMTGLLSIALAYSSNCPNTILLYSAGISITTSTSLININPLSINMYIN